MDKNPYIEDNRDSYMFTADYAKKRLIAPNGSKVFGVQGDHFGRGFYVKLLNFPEGTKDTINFKTSNNALVYLQFENAAGQTGQIVLQKIQEETTNRNDENKAGEEAVIYGANVPNSLTKEAGTVRLQLCGTYEYVDPNDPSKTAQTHWHLAPVEVEIAEFFENEDIAVGDPKYTLVEQAHSEIAALKKQTKELTKALNEALDDIKTSLDNLDDTTVDVGEAAKAQILANRTQIQELKQKITTLENAGADVAELSKTFATVSSVAAEYETKVHADQTYMRKDDEGYANMTDRIWNLEAANVRSMSWVDHGPSYGPQTTYLPYTASEIVIYVDSTDNEGLGPDSGVQIVSGASGENPVSFPTGNIFEIRLTVVRGTETGSVHKWAVMSINTDGTSGIHFISQTSVLAMVVPSRTMTHIIARY